MAERTALVTGGAQGLGKIIADHLINEGNDVIIFDIKEPLQKNGSKFFKVNLGNIKEVKSVLNKLKETEINIDILINNASLRNFKNFDSFTEEEIRDYIHVNLYSPLFLTNYLLNGMRKRNYGRIINIASRSGFWGYSTGSMYCSTKSALIKFTESLGKELALAEFNITANVICPDSFMTLEGRKLPRYEFVINHIKKDIFSIINSNINGKCFLPVRLPDKFIFIVRYIKQLLNL